MKKKRYTPPEALLQRTITQLENDEASRSHRAALRALLSDGPLVCPDAALEALTEPDSSEIRAELLAFLQTLVREEGHGRFSARIGLYGKSALTFSASELAGGQVVWAADGAVRDLVILQLMVLLQEIGLGQVRRCQAFDCRGYGGARRLFIKTHRREFCSTRCQKRTHTRAARAEERRKALRQARHNRRAS